MINSVGAGVLARIESMVSLIPLGKSSVQRTTAKSFCRKGGLRYLSMKREALLSSLRSAGASSGLTKHIRIVATFEYVDFFWGGKPKMECGFGNWEVEVEFVRIIALRMLLRSSRFQVKSGVFC